MNKEFVTIEIAEKLKRLGFVDPCFACYDNCGILSLMNSDMFNNKNYNIYGTITSAPLYQQTVNWIYDNFKLIVGIEAVSLNEWKGYVCMTTMALEDVIEINDKYSNEERNKGLEQAINVALDFELNNLIK